MWKVLSIILLCILAGLATFAQIPLCDVDYETVNSDKVIRYVKSFESDDCHNFSDLEASVDDSFLRNNYSYCEDSYEVNASVDKLWETCLNVNPEKLWKGKRISLSFIYNKIKDKIMYHIDQNDYKLEQNQIYFLNLRVLKGMYHLPTALKVTDINDSTKTIVFTYLKGGKSEGRQEISFVEDGEKNAKIVHKTHFRSHSKMRDKRIYPFFHRRIVRELHSNIAKEATKIE